MRSRTPSPSPDFCRREVLWDYDAAIAAAVTPPPSPKSTILRSVIECFPTHLFRVTEPTTKDPEPDKFEPAPPPRPKPTVSFSEDVQSHSAGTTEVPRLKSWAFFISPLKARKQRKVEDDDLFRTKRRSMNSEEGKTFKRQLEAEGGSDPAIAAPIEQDDLKPPLQPVSPRPSSIDVASVHDVFGHGDGMGEEGEIMRTSTENEEQRLFARLKAEAIKVNEEARYVEERAMSGDQVFTVECPTDDESAFEAPYVMQQPAEEATEDPVGQELTAASNASFVGDEPAAGSIKQPSEDGSMTEFSFGHASDEEAETKASTPVKDVVSSTTVEAVESIDDSLGAKATLGTAPPSRSLTATTLADELEVAGSEEASEAVEAVEQAFVEKLAFQEADPEALADGEVAEQKEIAREVLVEETTAAQDAWKSRPNMQATVKDESDE